MEEIINSITLTQSKALLILITTSSTLGLVILAIIMQAINFVRIMRIENKIKEKLNDLRIRK